MPDYPIGSDIMRDLVDAIVQAVDLGRGVEVLRLRDALRPLGLERAFDDELRLSGRATYFTDDGWDSCDFSLGDPIEPTADQKDPTAMPDTSANPDPVAYDLVPVKASDIAAFYARDIELYAVAQAGDMKSFVPLGRLKSMWSSHEGFGFTFSTGVKIDLAEDATFFARSRDVRTDIMGGVAS